MSFNIPTLHYIEDDARFEAMPHQRLPDDFEIRDALETIRFLGGTVVRIYTLSVRKPTDPPDAVRHVVGPGQFNEAAFVALDRVLAAAAELRVQVILPFVDNWPHWGGITEYAAFRSKQRSDFFNDDQLIADFEATIDKVLSRRNTINGRAYRDDPTIYAWETGNELSRPDAWAARIARYIKQRDPNHALIDGTNGPTIREASLANPDIDIVSSHHYGLVRRNIELVDQNVRKIAGRKRYLIGECGLWSAADTARMIEHLWTLPVEGVLLWGMRGHTREGGFYHHMEKPPFQSYHLTGSDSGASYGEREILGMMRRLAFEARGLPVPPTSAPLAPFMLSATSRGVVAFRGALGARDYVIDRQIAPDGQWERVADHFDETLVAYRAFVDRAPPIGQTVRYRVTALNDAGASPPSQPSTETRIEGRLFVDEMDRAGAGPRIDTGATVTTEHPERCKMDWSRLAGRAGARVEYRPPGLSTALRIYAFTESRSGQAFDVAWSADGKEFTRLTTSEDAFLVPGDAPETRRPVRATAATIPPAARALAITYLMPAEIGRVEIDWLPTNPVAASGDPVSASLAGLRLEAPCKGDKFGGNTECHWDPALKVDDPKWKLKREIVRKFGGTPGIMYDVTIRVRGVVEPKNFTGGTVQHDHFQIGGTPNVNHYNFYSLKVSDPAQDYTVNRHEKEVGHFLFAIDYTVTIPIRGGATVTMGEYDDNDISIANHQNIVVPEIPPAPAPFDGQFFQIDVVAVRPKP